MYYLNLNYENQETRTASLNGRFQFGIGVKTFGLRFNEGAEIMMARDELILLYP